MWKQLLSFFLQFEYICIVSVCICDWVYMWECACVCMWENVRTFFLCLCLLLWRCSLYIHIGRYTSPVRIHVRSRIVVISLQNRWYSHYCQKRRHSIAICTKRDNRLWTQFSWPFPLSCMEVRDCQAYESHQPLSNGWFPYSHRRFQRWWQVRCLLYPRSAAREGMHAHIPISIVLPKNTIRTC